MKNVLIIHPFGIGDVIFMTPFLDALRARPDVEKISLILGSRTESVFKNDWRVDDIFIVDKDVLSRMNFAAKTAWFVNFVWKLRKRKFDTVIDLSLSRGYPVLSKYILNVKCRAGIDYKNRGKALNVRVSVPYGFMGKHVVSFYHDLGRLLGLLFHEDGPRLIINNEEHRSALNMLDAKGIALKNFIAVCPGGGASWGAGARLKKWQKEKFANLINLLAKKFSLSNAVILGSLGESEECAFCSENINIKTVNLCGHTSLPAVFSVLSQALLFVGNDGGLVHAARALKVPTVAIYGPVDQEVYGPYPKGENYVSVYKKDVNCRPCYKGFKYRSDCLDNKCLNDLTVEEVLDTLKEQKFLERIRKIKRIIDSQ